MPPPTTHTHLIFGLTRVAFRHNATRLELLLRLRAEAMNAVQQAGKQTDLFSSMRTHPSLHGGSPSPVPSSLVSGGVVSPVRQSTLLIAKRAQNREFPHDPVCCATQLCHYKSNIAKLVPKAHTCGTGSAAFHGTTVHVHPSTPHQRNLPRDDDPSHPSSRLRATFLEPVWLLKPTSARSPAQETTSRRAPPTRTLTTRYAHWTPKQIRQNRLPVTHHRFPSESDNYFSEHTNKQPQLPSAKKKKANRTRFFWRTPVWSINTDQPHPSNRPP